MKIKKIKKIKINSIEFNIIWNYIKTQEQESDAWFSYSQKKIEFNLHKQSDDQIFELICHEIMEIVCVEMYVRFMRPDCLSDYMFVYDHRQHTSMMAMFSSIISKFIL